MAPRYHVGDHSMRVRVLTYNIHRAIGVDRRFRPERIASIVAHFDPDVLLLQEVDEGVPRSRGMDLASELADALDYPHVAVAHNVDLWQGRYGNATLSRYPIVKKSNIDLTVGLRKRRGCQHARLAIRASGTARHRLDIFNLHLGLSARERERQIALLAQSREFQSLKRGDSCLVAGDFNDWRSLLTPILEDLGLRSSSHVHGERRRAPTYPSFFPQGELDRIYYRGAVRPLSARPCRLPLCRVASDHLPMMAEFDLR